MDTSRHNHTQSLIHFSGDRRVEGFWAHLSIDGSLNGVSGRDSACEWAVVQLDYDKEEESRDATCGTMVAELEMQRTI